MPSAIRGAPSWSMLLLVLVTGDLAAREQSRQVSQTFAICYDPAVAMADLKEFDLLVLDYA
jgi:hypothetical protein